ncbi:MAG: heavy-metal-associated domain-containing protein [Fimbriimonadaceae bacterium]|jgi:copper chaperone|nr:heavy-metal-associated domain-containing protein [Armatimonadota bacterium]MBX3110200.1 heavy-metal-associated domain-containing protein [Fimbriimonadaceae bacterium]
MKLIVEGMTCQNCVRHVREALESIPGATDVSVNLQSGEVEVSGVEVRAAIEAVVEQGYQVRQQ